MASHSNDAISPTPPNNGQQTNVHHYENRHLAPSDVPQAPGADIRHTKREEVKFVDAHGETTTRLGTEKSNPFARMKLELYGSRTPSEDEMSEIETRPLPHHYILQRPRALQYTYRSKRINIGDESAPLTPALSGSSEVKYTAEGVSKSRERIDLFIDLVWVGIISNLSEVFSGNFFKTEVQSYVAFVEFIIVFLPAWRMWNYLREFLNNFYMDDPVQRFFILWILMLSVHFGNNVAYFSENYEEIKVYLISIYLITRASFVIMEGTYSVFIPWLRKLMFIGFLIALPSTGFWIAAIYVDGAKALGPAIAAILWEYIVPVVVIETPWGDKLTPGEYRKEVDPLHLRSRMGGFFIITVGEGVLMLVRGGPLGTGITNSTPLAVWSLVIYFMLTFIYFIRDNSITYVPAVRHRGWRLIIWIAWHIPIFSSFITLSAAILFFINRDSNLPVNTTESQLTDADFAVLDLRGLWCISSSLSVIMFSSTMLALLDKPLDPPKSHLVNNRLLRISGRFVYILIVNTVLLDPHMNVYLYLGICGLGLSLVLWYETIASLETPWRIVEPMGLTLLMKQAYKGSSKRND